MNKVVLIDFKLIWNIVLSSIVEETLSVCDLQQNKEVGRFIEAL